MTKIKNRENSGISDTVIHGVGRVEGVGREKGK